MVIELENKIEIGSTIYYIDNFEIIQDKILFISNYNNTIYYELENNELSYPQSMIFVNYNDCKNELIEKCKQTLIKIKRGLI